MLGGISDRRKGRVSMKVREYAVLVGLFGVVGCTKTAYVHPTPIQPGYLLSGKNGKTANIVMSDADRAKTSSAHFQDGLWLITVTQRWGESVPEYLQACTRKVFTDAAVNGTGQYDVVLDAKIIEADTNGFTGRANVTVSIDGRLADGRSLVSGQYAGAGVSTAAASAGPGISPILGHLGDVTPATTEVRTAAHLALTAMCDKLVSDLEQSLNR